MMRGSRIVLAGVCASGVDSESCAASDDTVAGAGAPCELPGVTEKATPCVFRYLFRFHARLDATMIGRLSDASRVPLGRVLGAARTPLGRLARTIGGTGGMSIGVAQYPCRRNS